MTHEDALAIVAAIHSFTEMYFFINFLLGLGALFLLATYVTMKS